MTTVAIIGITPCFALRVPFTAVSFLLLGIANMLTLA